nr:transmembrane and immunoglobulin domain-containing protein 2-like isoform X2 [Symphalangus syndactylus]
MGSPGMVLGLLLQLWALQGASSLSVQQEPSMLQVRQGSQATLVCQVDQAPAWERLRVKWTKDGAILCQPYITNGSLSLGVCGPQGRLSWQAPSHLTLQLDPVSLNHSGAYVCWAATEIPELEEAEGNVTRLFVAPDDPTQNRNPIASFPGNAFYSNVLYRPRGAPKKSEDCSGEGKDQRGQSIYSTSFPQPATRQLHLAPRPCPSPRPGHAASTVRVSPRPSPTLQPRPKGFPKVGEE